MKVNIPKIFLFTMLILIVFAMGRTFGYVQCQNRYLADYEYQSLQVDSLSARTVKLKETYDSIKKSPCYKSKL